MKKSRFTDSQIMSILKQAEAGTPVTYLAPLPFYWRQFHFHNPQASHIALSIPIRYDSATRREPFPTQPFLPKHQPRLWY